MDLQLTWYVVIFVLGLCFGSFFNVAIHRWPKEDPKEHEWVRTPSHCPRCNAGIRWYDNIPLFSYFVLLRGKCRDCANPISIRYPLVELGTALLWIITTWLVTNVGLSGVAISAIGIWHIVLALVLASIYLLTVIIDFETSLIPDEITITQLVVVWVFMLVCHGATISPGWQSSLIGMFALALFFLLLYLPGWMGDGDIYLAAGFGVLFGWKLVIVVGFLGIVLGGIYGMILMLSLLIKKKYKFGTEIPFGPYLAISAYICMFFGYAILEWYLGFLKPGAAAVSPISLLPF